MPMTMEEFSSSPFWQGFYWAKSLFIGMGKEISDKEMLDFLGQVARGEVTLSPSPEDAVKSLEADGPISDELKEMAKEMYKSGAQRRQSFETDKKTAQAYLDFLNS